MAINGGYHICYWMVNCKCIIPRLAKLIDVCTPMILPFHLKWPQLIPWHPQKPEVYWGFSSRQQARVFSGECGECQAANDRGVTCWRRLETWMKLPLCQDIHGDHPTAHLMNQHSYMKIFGPMVLRFNDDVCPVRSRHAHAHGCTGQG